MVLDLNTLTSIINSDLVSGLANLSQFYNVYQSTKAANYSEMVSEIQNQTLHIDNVFNDYAKLILNEIIKEIDNLKEQNSEILNLLKELKESKG